MHFNYTLKFQGNTCAIIVKWKEWFCIDFCEEKDLKKTIINLQNILTNKKNELESKL